MALPEQLINALRLPVIGAPMFLVSFPPLVTAICKAGLVGSFPHINARPSEQFDEWLTTIADDLKAHREAHPDAVTGPLAVNLVVHRSNPRFKPDLEIVVKHEVPLVLTSLGGPREVVEAVHSYGGLVFCDVVNPTHARKAAAAGVDGIICIGGGAGGHASIQSSFSLVRQIREFWDGCLILGGAINDGYQIRAAETLGADLAYVGTRFLMTQESNAQDEYKHMILEADVENLVYTDRLSGVGCNFLKPSLDRYGIVPEDLPPKQPDLSSLIDTEAKLWRDIWTAGHGVATIHDVPSVGTLVDRLEQEYRAACALSVSRAIRSA